MADYSEIKGFTIQSLASDPVATAVEAGTWAAGNNLNTAKGYGASGGTSSVGTQTNAVNATGANASDFLTLETELYDGTSWTVSPGTLTTGRTGGGGAGVSSTSALMFGGFIPPSTRTDVSETWNGSTWTEGNNLNSGRNDTSGSGIVTAAFCVAGYDGPSSSAVMETYDGTCWTETNNLNRSTSGGVAMGLTTAGIYAGGPSPSALVETWDGTSWTEVGDLNSGRYKGSGAGNSSNTANIIFGGGEPVPTDGAKTESWNGTAWTELADLSTALIGNGGCGTNTVGLNVGGSTSPAPGNQQVATEEWAIPSAVSIAQEGQVWYNTTSTVLKGFGAQGALGWSAGNNLNTSRRMLSAGGSGRSSGIVFGGRTSDPTATNVSETWDGSTWTEGDNVLQARFTGTGFGVETAAIFATGLNYPTATRYTNTETYDGTSWTEGNDINVGRGYLAGCGTATAGLAIGGYYSPPTTRFNIVEDYDGTSWTETADLSTSGINSLAAAVQGTPSAALAFGGYPPSNRTEEFDGTSWTETANLNVTRSNAMGSGTQTAGLAIGGSSPPASPSTIANVESYNGSAWTETSYDLGTGRYQGAAFGSATNAVVAGGSVAGVYSNATEELANADATKTFTAS